VAFLLEPLTAKQELILLATRSSIDDFIVSDREVYWVCGIAQNESKFSNAVFERKLKVRTTFRKGSMLSKLSNKHF
jgi:hypothetical protein